MLSRGWLSSWAASLAFLAQAELLELLLLWGNPSPPRQPGQAKLAQPYLPRTFAAQQAAASNCLVENAFPFWKQAWAVRERGHPRADPFKENVKCQRQALLPGTRQAAWAIAARSLQGLGDARRAAADNWLRQLSGALENGIPSLPSPWNPLKTLHELFPRFSQAAANNTFCISYAFIVGSFLRPKTSQTWFQLKLLC